MSSLNFTIFTQPCLILLSPLAVNLTVNFSFSFLTTSLIKIAPVCFNIFDRPHNTDCIIVILTMWSVCVSIVRRVDLLYYRSPVESTALVRFKNVFLSNYISKLSNHTMLVSNHLHCFNLANAKLFCLLFGKVNLVNAGWLVVGLGLVWLQQLQEVIPWSCFVEPKLNWFKGRRDDRVLHMWVSQQDLCKDILHVATVHHIVGELDYVAVALSWPASTFSPLTQLPLWLLVSL